MNDEVPAAGELAPEAKGVGESFVRTLGLHELIFGSLLVYWVRVTWQAVAWSRILPGTGREWIDIALLACAAALSGKALSIAVEMWIGLFDLVLDLSNSLGRGYITKLEGSLREYCQSVGRRLDIESDDLRDLSVSYLVVARPRDAEELERLRVSPAAAYAGVVLTTLYAFYFQEQSSAPSAIHWALFVIALVLLIGGIAGQLDYTHTLRDRLEALIAAGGAGTY